jgi:hypothetical protein
MIFSDQAEGFSPENCLDSGQRIPDPASLEQIIEQSFLLRVVAEPSTGIR